MAVREIKVFTCDACGYETDALHGAVRRDNHKIGRTYTADLCQTCYDKFNKMWAMQFGKPFAKEQ